MRMRKKKWADPWLSEHADYIYEDPSDMKGKWRELLGGDVLHVEIGTGKGDYLNTMAAMYPEEAWVGIEKDRSAAAVAARKAVEAEDADLHNKRMIVNQAEDMENWFAEKEIDVIHLNFSDPWPKKHAHKRRLSSDKFLQMYARLLSDRGRIRMKTDNKDLFEDSVLYFLNNGFTLTEFSVDFRRTEHPEDAVTEYERRFMDLGQPIYLLTAVCNKEK
ncbi:MAG TPA: tRNA (guanosine(46)-N7)-methyltransferase TrmB [Erysipelotrichaceae bacterium]|nr:tRNA (guanosine(46)-N7)-methyltransferase TrmB [Erysipelotrichaceae bacterium]